MSRLSPLLHLVLALLLALTAQQMALARGQAMAVGEAVLCIGGAAVSVAVDAEGKPTGHSHICPDAALSLIAAPGLTDLQLIRAAGWQRVAVPVPALELPVSAVLRPASRGPPALV